MKKKEWNNSRNKMSKSIAAKQYAEDKVFVEGVIKGTIGYIELCNKFRRIISAVSYKYLSNSTDIKEVFHETTQKVYLSIHKFKGEAKLTTWVWQVAKNCSINKSKSIKRGVKKRCSSLDDNLNTEEGEIIKYETIGSKKLNTFEEIIGRELEKIIYDAVDSLGLKNKEVFLLYERESLTYEEISKLKELSVGTVKSRINRAREYIKGRVKENGYCLHGIEKRYRRVYS